MASKPHIRTLVYCPLRKKMVEKGTEAVPDVKGVMIIPPMEPIKSPITGEMITSREQLARHHRAHGTTDARDYSAEFLQKRAAERELRANGAHPEDRANRISHLRRAIFETRR